MPTCTCTGNLLTDPLDIVAETVAHVGQTVKPSPDSATGVGSVLVASSAEIRAARNDVLAHL